MDKHIEIWDIARKAGLGIVHKRGLGILLDYIENNNQQLILQNVSLDERSESTVCEHYCKFSDYCKKYRMYKPNCKNCVLQTGS